MFAYNMAFACGAHTENISPSMQIHALLVLVTE